MRHTKSKAQTKRLLVNRQPSLRFRQAAPPMNTQTPQNILLFLESILSMVSSTGMRFGYVCSRSEGGT